MAPGHSRLAADRSGEAFGLAIVLNVVYVAIEAAAGLLIGSLALVSDAGHNLSDVATLTVAWGARRLVQVPPSARRTYGWQSSSILAALFNSLVILLAMGGIAWEAVQRLWSPTDIAGSTVIWVAGIGVVVNTATALLFLRGRTEGDLNIKAALLHMAADAGVSAGVVLAGVAILFTGWQWIDPVVSLAIVLVILYGSWGLLRESGNLALHAVPEAIDPGTVKTYLRTLPGVVDVHDLHIWAMSTTDTAMTAHLVKPEIDDEDALLRQASGELQERFGIGHSTLQIERGRKDERCPRAEPDTV